MFVLRYGYIGTEQSQKNNNHKTEKTRKHIEMPKSARTQGENVIKAEQQKTNLRKAPKNIQKMHRKDPGPGIYVI